MKNNLSILKGIEAVIFDMDGVLIDSEPVWKDAMEEVFESVGCPLTREDFQKTVGLRLDEVIAYWFQISPWQNVSPEDVMQRIINRMVELLGAHGKPLTGVVETLEFLKQKGLKIGLATSSYEVLIDCVLDTLSIRHFFDFTHSAEREAYGKPHPAVYLKTAETLGVHPQHCLVIEDSINGVISGKAARMHVVCIPEKTHLVNPKLILADYNFETMADMLHAIKQ
jgi:HAD superfamily hydrolase (TIGR01509 family)